MPNDLVKKGYNKMATDYSTSRDQFKNQEWLEKLDKLLKPNSTILDIGCGAGIPIDKYFIDHGHKVIGIDISEEQVKLARKNLPTGTFEMRDMEDLKEKEFSVDAVVSFYAIFHIPKKKTRRLAQKDKFVFKTWRLFVGDNGGK